MADQFEIDDAWQKLADRAWSDPALTAKLLADPTAVLKANGVTVPAGITVQVVENTDKLVHLILPVNPPSAELSEEELHQAAGGRKYYTRDNDQGPHRDWDRLVGDCDPNN